MTLLERLPRGASLILVDGTCIFCNRLVSFILRHDRRREFHFAHLQSALGRDILRRHGAPPNDVDGVYLLLDPAGPNERLVVDGAAGREIWPRLFPILFFVRWLPIRLLDVQYRLFARIRYRLFGQADTCILPSEADRDRFIADPLAAETIAPSPSPPPRVAAG